MSPLGIGFLGVGTFMKSYADIKKGYAEADAHEANADFYRQQAKFAREAGDRQIMIFDRESVVLHGDQESAFAKAGVDTQESASYIAKEMFFRGQERHAIYEEADLNVRLASLRAESSYKQAEARKEAVGYQVMGNYLNMGSEMAGSS